MSGTSKSLIALLILVAIAVISVTTIIFTLLFPALTSEEPEPVVIIPELENVVMPTVLFEEATVCEPLNVQIEFRDQDGTIVDHVNYDIDAIQNDNTLLTEIGVHRHQDKHPVHQTDVLLGVFPIDFIVTMQGIGHGEDIIEPIDKSYTLTVTPNAPSEINCELLHENVAEELPQ